MTCEVETLMVLSYKYQDIKLQIPVDQLPDFCGPYKIHKINIYVRNLRVVFVLTLPMVQFEVHVDCNQHHH